MSMSGSSCIAAHQVRHVPRLMLAVAVDLYEVVVVILERILEAGLDGATDSEVEGVGDDHGSGLGRPRLP